MQKLSEEKSLRESRVYDVCVRLFEPDDCDFGFVISLYIESAMWARRNRVLLGYVGK